MNFSELIYARRSTRGFTDREVSDDDIMKLLNAAVNAPNACNYQSWHFYCIRGREAIKRFSSDVCRGGWVSSAPVIFVVCTDSKRLGERFGERGTGLFAIQDTACAVDHLLLMAAELGMNGCFIGAFDENKCRSHLNTPEGYRPVAIVPVGYAAENLPKRERRPLVDVCTFIGGSPDALLSVNDI